MSNVKREINEWKKVNGNNSYSDKEMLQYLVSRVDKLTEQVGDCHAYLCAQKETTSGLDKRYEGLMNMMRILIPAQITVTLAIISYIILYVR